MKNGQHLSMSVTLEELKTRGNDAMAETREIIRDMRSHAAEVRHTATTTIRGVRVRGPR